MAINWVDTRRARAALRRERGAIIQDWGGRLAIALVFPNRYFVGMSCLGFQLVYRLFNNFPGSLCERAFLDGSGTILSLESQRPLADFVAVAFSVSFELDYFGIVEALRRSGLPLWSEQRDERHPLVIAGGPCVTANPEPIAQFCDAIVIGEAEAIVPRLSAMLLDVVQSDREEQLNALSTLPGVYVPLLHRPGVTAPVKRQWVRYLDDWPAASIIRTPETELGDTLLVEVARGCARGCRFCLAGFCFRPMRPRSIQRLFNEIDDQPGTKRVGLVGAAVSDHPDIDALVSGLRNRGLRLSASSLRAESLTPKLLQGLAESGARTITLAPEAGSERLRAGLNKTLTDDGLLDAIRAIGGWRFSQLKLYFMAGLPGDDGNDSDAIIRLVERVQQALEASTHGMSISVNLGPFVPKAQTPLERVAMAPVPVLRDNMRYVRQQLRQRGARITEESAEWAEVQGVLSRGDRRLADVIASMTSPTLASWRLALREASLDAQDFVGEWPASRTLPWQVVESGVHPAYRHNEACRVLDQTDTPPCPSGWCQRCGVC